MVSDLEEYPEFEREGGRSLAFLLRCWQEPGGDLGGGPAWRFSLTRVGGMRLVKGFAQMEGVIAYLQEILAAEDDDIQRT